MTATGTDVGKTFVTAGLIRACRRAGIAVDALKPVMSGFDPASPHGSDAGLLLAALGREITPAMLDSIAPWRFAAPLSPNMAAAFEHRTIDFAALTAVCQAAVSRPILTVLEGVGGVMVPLDGQHTILDLIAALPCPSILVSGTALGAISHCLTAVAALATRGLAPSLIVLNESDGTDVPLPATIDTIRAFCPGLPVAILPRNASDEVFDRLLERVADAISSFRGQETPATSLPARV